MHIDNKFSKNEYEKFFSFIVDFGYFITELHNIQILKFNFDFILRCFFYLAEINSLLECFIELLIHTGSRQVR